MCAFGYVCHSGVGSSAGAQSETRFTDTGSRNADSESNYCSGNSTTCAANPTGSACGSGRANDYSAIADSRADANATRFSDRFASNVAAGFANARDTSSGASRS